MLPRRKGALSGLLKSSMRALVAEERRYWYTECAARPTHIDARPNPQPLAPRG